MNTENKDDIKRRVIKRFFDFEFNPNEVFIRKDEKIPEDLPTQYEVWVDQEFLGFLHDKEQNERCPNWELIICKEKEYPDKFNEVTNIFRRGKTEMVFRHNRIKASDREREDMEEHVLFPPALFKDMVSDSLISSYFSELIGYDLEEVKFIR